MVANQYPEVLCEDILLHKALVFLVGGMLVRDFVAKADSEKALKLGARISAHDNSKWDWEEFDGMSRYIKCLTMKDGKYEDLPPEQKVAGELHISKNSHHPEYYGRAFNDYMTEMDILEMAVDLFCRSLQWGTDVFDYVNNKDRFRTLFDERIKKALLAALTWINSLYEEYSAAQSDVTTAINALLRGVRAEQQPENSAEGEQHA